MQSEQCCLAFADDLMVTEYRLAIVEDSLIESRLCEKRLGDLGYQVSSFASGEKLLAGIKNGGLYDAILVDQILPGGITGLMTYEHLLACKIDTPVIMVTSFVSTELICAFTKAGGAAYVPKPITDWEHLDWVIQKVIERRKKSMQLEELKKRTQELETQQKTADAFLDLVAHDLRKPITVIIGSVQCVNSLDCVVEDAQAKQLVENIERYSLRLSAFLNSIISVCSVNKRQPFDTRSTDLAELLTTAVADLKSNILKDVDLEYANFGSCHVRVNHSQLFQVLLNLVDNAVKYSKTRPDIKIISQDSQLREYIEILVVDHGIGINEKQLPFIFDQFRRVKELEDVEGNGLGLFISKQIIEMMGGQIWALSKEGQGTTFVLRLKRESAS